MIEGRAHDLTAARPVIVPGEISSQAPALAVGRDRAGSRSDSIRRTARNVSLGSGTFEILCDHDPALVQEPVRVRSDLVRGPGPAFCAPPEIDYRIEDLKERDHAPFAGTRQETRTARPRPRTSPGIRRRLSPRERKILNQLDRLRKDLDAMTPKNDQYEFVDGGPAPHLVGKVGKYLSCAKCTFEGEGAGLAGRAREHGPCAGA